jgi:tetratricopeptide (TPR) repeat protein
MGMSKMPNFNIPLFIGRSSALEAIFAWLENTRSREALQIIGEGGIGKTTLAAEVFRILDGSARKSQYWKIWVDFDEPQHERLDGVLNSISEQLGLQNITTLTDLRRDIFESLLRRPTLIVFDTFDRTQNNDEILSFVSKLLLIAKVIIISRQGVRELIQQSHMLELPQFSSMETDVFLKQKTLLLNLSSSDYEKILQIASGRPIYIDLLVEWVRQGNSLDDLSEVNYPKDRLLDVDIKDILLKKIIPPAEWEIVKAATIFPSAAKINELAYVAGVRHNRVLLDKLKSLSYIKTLPLGQIGLHDELRFLAKQQISQNERRTYERRYVEYFASIIEAGNQETLEVEWANIEKAIDLLILDRNITLAWKLIGNLNDFLFSSNRENRFLYWADRVVDIAAEENDAALLASVINDRAVGLVRSGQFEKAIKQLKELLDQEVVAKTPSLRSSILSNIGGIYIQTARYDEARLIFEHSLNIAQEIGDKQSEISSIANLAVIYRSRGEWQRSLTMLKQAYHLAEEIGDQHALANVLGQQAGIYEQTADRKKSLDMYARQLLILRELGNRSGEFRTHSRMGELYLSEGNYESAEKEFLNALELSRETNLQKPRAQILNRLAEIRKVAGDLSTAMVYANEGIRLAEQTENNAEIAVGSAIIGDCRKELGKYEDAIYLYKRALQIYLEGKPTRSIVSLYLKLAEVYESIYQTQNIPDALKTAVENYEHAQISAAKFRQKDTSLVAQIQLGGLYVKAYRKSGDESHWQSAITILNRVETNTKNNEILISLSQENLGQAYYARYEQTKDKDELIKAHEYLQKAFDFAVSKNNLAKWSDLVPVLSQVYLELNQKVNWNQIWEFGLQFIQGLARGVNSHYTNKVAEIIAGSAKSAFESGEYGFAFQQLAALSDSFEKASLTTPDAVRLVLDDLRNKLGEEKFTLMYAEAYGRLTSGVAPLLEESRTLMGNRQFEAAAQKLGEALTLLVDDHKDDYKRQKATILFLRGLCLREQQIWEVALQDQEQAFDLYVALKDLAGQAHTLLEIGFLYEFMNSYEDARIHYMDAYRLYKKVQDKKGLANAVEHLGTLEFRVRMYQQALENLEEAQNLYVELGDRHKALSLNADIADAKAGLQQGSTSEEKHD